MPLDIQVLEDLCKQCSNWGKWGADDELGTLNYITPRKVVEASGLVKRGRVFGLALPYDANGPQRGLRGRFNPIRLMIARGANPGGGYSDDVVTMPTQCGTQWDSLAHIFYHGKMWNGLDQALVTSAGAAKNSIDKMKDSVVSRGVLLDIARHKGLDWLEDGYAITSDDRTALPTGKASRWLGATSCWSAPARWPTAGPREAGAPTQAAMRPASHCSRRAGSIRKSSPR